MVDSPPPMEWKTFLEEMSDRLRLTPEQREVFVARLADENIRASEAKIAVALNLSEAAVKKHMNAIYEEAGRVFSAIAEMKGRGKLKELRACLKQEWRNAPLPPQFWGEPNQGESIQEAPNQSVGSQSPPILGDIGGAKPLRSTPKSPLKPGAPFPRVRLPDNFVERPQALQAVKDKLLVESDQTLVVSAISGLGGLGKSVLATTIVLDLEVQARFPDGILWVTLGQKPDLQTLLGDWIRELDKSREAFSAKTLESASRYLDSLLAEREMLLVVDDVWNADHAEWFRVGGAGCRVLVTTREAQIEGAEYHELDLMTEDEAIDLVQQKLKQKWRPEQEAEVKAFAKVLGYLPLALDLAANQVRDGLSWAELRTEFEAERRSVALGTGRRSRALELLDSSEAWEHLEEEKQRKYSLQACFNLSLKRLTDEQLRQFAWLGVLPEDVSLNKQMAAVLWNVRSPVAQKILTLLRNRSFLTDGAATLEDEPTYRVHDLMHDMARSLIEEGILNAETQTVDDPAQNLAIAHRQFLERYRECAIDRRWDKLPNDRYIHRHLTWHMEQARCTDEVHALMAMSDERGRNAWFEACDRLGQPAIFVEDVARGWRLAEKLYEKEPTRAIVLQCRYALIQATLNSLVANLPVGMMAEFVKRSFWTVEQAWAYVEQMQDENTIAEAIQALAPYLSKPLFQLAVEKERAIQDNYRRALMLSNLAKVDATYLGEALEVAQTIQDDYYRAEILSNLAKVDMTYFGEALEAERTIQDDYYRAEVLSNLAKVDGADFTALLDTARTIQDDYYKVKVLSNLAKVDGADFTALLDTARTIQNKLKQAEVLSNLAKVDSSYFNIALKAARVIRDEDSRAKVLSDLAKIDGADFTALLDTARTIQDKSKRVIVLSSLRVSTRHFSEALEAARTIQNEHDRAKELSNLTKVDGADFTALLDAALTLQNKSIRAQVLSNLAELDSAKLIELLEVVKTIKDTYALSQAIVNMAHHSLQHETDVANALHIVRLNSNEIIYAFFLQSLALKDSRFVDETIEFASTLRSELDFALIIGELVCQYPHLLSQALNAASNLSIESERNLALDGLFNNLTPAMREELIQVVQSLENDKLRAEILSRIDQLVSVCQVAHPGIAIHEDLRKVKEIQGKTDSAEYLSELLPHLPLWILSLAYWQDYLHLLAYRKRENLMRDLAKLQLTIIHLGGEEALHGVIKVMQEVCLQWK